MKRSRTAVVVFNAPDSTTKPKATKVTNERGPKSFIEKNPNPPHTLVPPPTTNLDVRLARPLTASTTACDIDNLRAQLLLKKNEVAARANALENARAQAIIEAEAQSLRAELLTLEAQLTTTSKTESTPAETTPHPVPNSQISIEERILRDELDSVNKQLGPPSETTPNHPLPQMSSEERILRDELTSINKQLETVVIQPIPATTRVTIADIELRTNYLRMELRGRVVDITEATTKEFMKEGSLHTRQLWSFWITDSSRRSIQVAVWNAKGSVRLPHPQTPNKGDVVCVSGFSGLTTNYSVRENKIFDKFHTCQLSAESPPKGGLRFTLQSPDATLGWEKELNPFRSLSTLPSTPPPTPTKPRADSKSGFCCECGASLATTTKVFCEVTGAKH